MLLLLLDHLEQKAEQCSGGSLLGLRLRLLLKRRRRERLNGRAECAQQRRQSLLQMFHLERGSGGGRAHGLWRRSHFGRPVKRRRWDVDIKRRGGQRMLLLLPVGECLKLLLLLRSWMMIRGRHSSDGRHRGLKRRRDRLRRCDDDPIFGSGVWLLDIAEHRKDSLSAGSKGCVADLLARRRLLLLLGERVVVVVLMVTPR